MLNSTLQLLYNPGEYIPSPIAPEGVPTVTNTVTMENLSPEGRALLERNKQRIKEREQREYEEHRRKTDVRFTGEKPLQTEDHLFGLALTGMKAPIASTLGTMTNPVSAKTTIGALVATGLAAYSNVSDINYYSDLLTGKAKPTVTDLLIAASPLLVRAPKNPYNNSRYQVDTNKAQHDRDSRVAIHSNIINIKHFPVSDHASWKGYIPPHT